MGLNGFSEKTLRDYLHAILGTVETDTGITRHVGSIAKNVNDTKKKMRRASDKPTHEKLLAKVFIQFYEKGRLDGVRTCLGSFKNAMEADKGNN